MARRYDSSTTTFSPEGRLHQVEYAIEAINNAGTSVGILAKDGVVMASERKITSGLLAPARVSYCNNIIIYYLSLSWHDIIIPVVASGACVFFCTHNLLTLPLCYVSLLKQTKSTKKQCHTSC